MRLILTNCLTAIAANTGSDAFAALIAEGRQRESQIHNLQGDEFSNKWPERKLGIHKTIAEALQLRDDANGTLTSLGTNWTSFEAAITEHDQGQANFTTEVGTFNTKRAAVREAFDAAVEADKVAVQAANEKAQLNVERANQGAKK